MGVLQAAETLGRGARPFSRTGRQAFETPNARLGVAATAAGSSSGAVFLGAFGWTGMAKRLAQALRRHTAPRCGRTARCSPRRDPLNVITHPTPTDAADRARPPSAVRRSAITPSESRRHRNGHDPSHGNTMMSIMVIVNCAFGRAASCAERDLKETARTTSAAKPVQQENPAVLTLWRPVIRSPWARPMAEDDGLRSCGIRCTSPASPSRWTSSPPTG